MQVKHSQSLPDGSGPHFDWVWGLYNGTHSALVFPVCFAAVWLLLRKPPLEMLGWALHILIDVSRTAACWWLSFYGRFRRFISMASGGKRPGFWQRISQLSRQSIFAVDLPR
jgi:hypothetical protein